MYACTVGSSGQQDPGVVCPSSSPLPAPLTLPPPHCARLSIDLATPRAPTAWSLPSDRRAHVRCLSRAPARWRDCQVSPLQPPHVRPPPPMAWLKKSSAAAPARQPRLPDALSPSRRASRRARQDSQIVRGDGGVRPLGASQTGRGCGEEGQGIQGRRRRVPGWELDHSAALLFSDADLRSAAGSPRPFKADRFSFSLPARLPPCPCGSIPHFHTAPPAGWQHRATGSASRRQNSAGPAVE